MSLARGKQQVSLQKGWWNLRFHSNPWHPMTGYLYSQPFLPTCITSLVHLVQSRVGTGGNGGVSLCWDWFRNKFWWSLWGCSFLPNYPLLSKNMAIENPLMVFPLKIHNSLRSKVCNHLVKVFPTEPQIFIHWDLQNVRYPHVFTRHPRWRSGQG